MSDQPDKAAEIFAKMPKEAREFLRTGKLPAGAEVMTPQPATRPYDEPLHPHLGVPYGEWPQFPGASMRDFFAANYTIDPNGFTVTHAETLMGEAMPAFRTPKERYDWWLTAEAKYRYAYADAMLRERGK